jgi:predicted amidophosphoribosyltransferase
VLGQRAGEPHSDMPAVQINPVKLPGPWVEGYVLDLHTVSCTFLGYDGSIPRFDTKYTELGELVYRFKYQGEKAALPPIVDTVEHFIRKLKWSFDFIVAAPPSIHRDPQPVTEIARELSSRLGVPVHDEAVLKVKTTPPMQHLEFPSDRAKMLEDAFRGEAKAVRGKRVLVVDDLFEYGSTVGAVAKVLVTEGEAAAVYMVALTRRRT